MNCIPSIFSFVDTCGIGVLRRFIVEFVAIAMFAVAIPLQAQSTKPEPPATPQAEVSQDLQQRVAQLEAEVSELKTLVKQLASEHAGPSAASERTAATDPRFPRAIPPFGRTFHADDSNTLDFLRGTTINLALDSLLRIQL